MIKKLAQSYIVCSGTLSVTIDKTNGRPSALTAHVNGSHMFCKHDGDVAVRDDLLRRTYDSRDVEAVEAKIEAEQLQIIKVFRGVPWQLQECYTAETDAIHWKARLLLPKGDFRSVAVTWQHPWPTVPYAWQLWAARHDMPKALHQAASEWIEYGEVTSAALIPAVALYHPSEKWGIAICKPFELRTPRLRFGLGYRDPLLRVRFDWLALSPQRSAEVEILFRGIPGCWRPALGWLYDRYRSYFDSKSTLLPHLWGGHNCSGYDQKEDDIRAGAAVGEKWCEIHAHFPFYGQYDAQADSWTSITHAWHTPPEDGSKRFETPLMTVEECRVTPEVVRRTIQRLDRNGVAAMPYLQVSGDASPPVADRFAKDRIRDLHGEIVSWQEMGTSKLIQMNADPSLAFGRHLDEMMDGILEKYKGLKGIFVDQACYNFVDTAHSDGITAINNQPAYMTGFNYASRLERLSFRIHPGGAIMANGPHSIEIMRWLDGVMAEGLDWLCDQFQYYALAKPMYFLLYQANRMAVETMLQNALIYAAGYTAAEWARDYRDLFEAYLPLINRLANRRWIFDPDPLTLPHGFSGNIYRAADGNLLVSLVCRQTLLPNSAAQPAIVKVRVTDVSKVQWATIRMAGQEGPETVALNQSGDELEIGPLPENLVAGLLELEAAVK